MTATDLLAACSARGILLTPAGEYLDVTPAAAVTPDLRELLVQRKPELLAVLTRPEPARTYPCTGCNRFRFGEPTRCYWCRNPAKA